MSGRGELQPSGFGNRLRTMREQKGWSQRELGEAADVHPNTIAKLERGEQEPSWPLVLKFATALAVDCTAFASANAPESPKEEVEPEKHAPKKPKGKK